MLRPTKAPGLLRENQVLEGIQEDPEVLVRVLMRTPFPEDYEDPPLPPHLDDETDRDVDTVGHD